MSRPSGHASDAVSSRRPSRLPQQTVLNLLVVIGRPALRFEVRWRSHCCYVPLPPTR